MLHVNNADAIFCDWDDKTIFLYLLHFPAVTTRWYGDSVDDTHTRLTALFPGLPKWAGTRKVNQSGFYWSKRQWVAVASAGPYASLYLAPYR